MPIDLSEADFLSAPDIGVTAGVDFPAYNASFRMMRFNDCHLSMETCFPVVNRKWSSVELFGIFSAEKYQEFLSQTFEDCDNNPTYENVFAFCGSPNYWHFMVDFVGNLPLLKHFPGGVETRVLIASRKAAHSAGAVSSVPTTGWLSPSGCFTAIWPSGGLQ